MPELPEVETIKRELEPLVLNHLIERIEFSWPKTLRGLTIQSFSKDVLDQEVVGLSRRGKYLILKLNNGRLLLVHFKMTGSFLAGDKNTPTPNHTRATITFKDGTRLFFVDPRKFGRFMLVSENDEPLSSLGDEPLSKRFTPDRLSELLSKRKSPIKIALLDQGLIAGIGNMYADEILFLSGIHPLRPANSLSRKEVEQLHQSIRLVLRRAILNKGASVENYFRPGGSKGKAHSEFNVAHRKGLCNRCRGMVERIVVRGRGTYFCPSCQH